MDVFSRRRFIAWSATSIAVAACEATRPSLLPVGAISPSPQRTLPPGASATPTSSPPVPTTGTSVSAAPSVGSPTPNAPAAGRRVLYRDAALADGRSPDLRLGVSVLVTDDVITWIRPRDAEDDPGPADGLEIVDASGATIVPGMVDCHSHLTGPGGARWIERFSDAPERLAAYAEANARLLYAAGVRWARDVGSPRVADPVDGRERGLAIGIRDRWAGRREYPYVRAAGTWIFRAGTPPGGLAVEAGNADELLGRAVAQLDDGADLVKVYLDGPDAATSPWSVAEMQRVVEAVHGRGAKVAAHSSRVDGARVGAEAGVDSLEHGFELDASVARTMAERGVALVSTLTVMRSWLTFSRTTTIPGFASAEGRASVESRLERATESVRLARAAGVAICAGTDFGGGSARANQLAWEVESLVAAGLEPWEALGAATWRGGELLGEPEAGVIRETGPADFFLVHGDPLSEPAALWRVWRVA